MGFFGSSDLLRPLTAKWSSLAHSLHFWLDVGHKFRAFQCICTTAKYSLILGVSLLGGFRRDVFPRLGFDFCPTAWLISSLAAISVAQEWVTWLALMALSGSGSRFPRCFSRIVFLFRISRSRTSDSRSAPKPRDSESFIDAVCSYIKRFI